MTSGSSQKGGGGKKLSGWSENGICTANKMQDELRPPLPAPGAPREAQERRFRDHGWGRGHAGAGLRKPSGLRGLWRRKCAQACGAGRAQALPRGPTALPPTSAFIFAVAGFRGGRRVLVARRSVLVQCGEACRRAPAGRLSACPPGRPRGYSGISPAPARVPRPVRGFRAPLRRRLRRTCRPGRSPSPKRTES